MQASSALVSQAAVYVRRSRAGDQNATAMLRRVGAEARKGNQRAAQSFEAMKAYIEQNPAQPFQLGAEPVVIAEGSLGSKVADTPPKAVNLELRKPPLPRGIFERLFDPEFFAIVIVRACQYRNGLPAAAAVLASGPALTNNAIRQIGASNFGSEESTATFFHGVKFPDEKAWAEVAPHLDLPLRRCLAIGQCVGRARKIQAVRLPNSTITQYSDVAGWELGE
jgi:hypothetical protein